MIISFNGDHGSGKSTIAKKIAESLSYPRYYMGQIFRDMAAKRNLTLVEYLKLGEVDPAIDREVDDYIVELSKKESDFVIEGRTAWHFIPNSLKIYLKVSEEEGAKRIFKELESDATRKNEDKSLDSIENIIKSERSRKEGDDKRYKKYYGIDIHNEDNYDFVLDTTNLSREEVFQKTMEFVESRMK